MNFWAQRFFGPGKNKRLVALRLRVVCR